MKKYLLSLFAILLAVGFSAFTPAPKATTGQNALYWYWEDTKILISDEPSVEPPNECELTGDPLCAYGCVSNTETQPEINFVDLGFFP